MITCVGFFTGVGATKEKHAPVTRLTWFSWTGSNGKFFKHELSNCKLSSDRREVSIFFALVNKPFYIIFSNFLKQRVETCTDLTLKLEAFFNNRVERKIRIACCIPHGNWILLMKTPKFSFLFPSRDFPRASLVELVARLWFQITVLLIQHVIK